MKLTARLFRSFGDSTTTASVWILMMWALSQTPTWEYAAILAAMGFVALCVAAAFDDGSARSVELGDVTARRVLLLCGASSLVAALVFFAIDTSPIRTGSAWMAWSDWTVLALLLANAFLFISQWDTGKSK